MARELATDAAATGAIQGTETKPRSFGRKFWVIVAMIIVTAISPWIPCLWGLKMGWIGVSNGIGTSSWSMAAHNGIMPGSIVYKKALSEYSAGDKISFEYKGSADPNENGLSLKLVTAKNDDGTYRVKGMNTNSDPPCNVKPEDIEGKVVWSQSFMPESYWRWLSLDWTLNTDEIDARWHAIFSLRTIGAAFTRQGRVRNWAEWRFSHNGIHWGPSDLWTVQHKTNKFKIFSGTNQLTETKGVISEWEGDKLTYRISRPTGEYRILRWSRTGTDVIEDVKLSSFSKTTPQGWRVYGRGPMNRNPLAILDGNLYTAWGGSISGSYWELDLIQPQPFKIKCWGGSSGTWPIKDGWESSLDGQRWYPVRLESNGITTTSPNDPNAYSMGKVKARYLRYTPTGVNGGTIELKIE